MKDKRILIIDDELSLLESLEMFLKACSNRPRQLLNV
jgi:hypothetical protein